MTERGVPALSPQAPPPHAPPPHPEERTLLGLRLEGRGLAGLDLPACWNPRPSRRDAKPHRSSGGGGWAAQFGRASPQRPISRHPLGCGAWLEKACDPQMEGRRGTAGFASPSLPAVECEMSLFRLAGVETRRSAHGVGGLLRRIPGGRHSPRYVSKAARPWPARNHQPDFNRIRQQGAANGTEQPGLLTGCRPAEPCDLGRRTREGA